VFIWGRRPLKTRWTVNLKLKLDEAIVLADRILVMTARPGRIKDICDVSTIFPRPRRVEQVKSSPLYGELFGRVWGQLRQEVLEATGQPVVTR